LSREAPISNLTQPCLTVSADGRIRIQKRKFLHIAATQSCAVRMFNVTFRSCYVLRLCTKAGSKLEGLEKRWGAERGIAAG
jgi:predicted metallopeptidase